jgi:hypothetical protein
MTTSDKPILLSPGEQHQLNSDLLRNNLDGEFSISDYVHDKPVSYETRGEVKRWIEQDEAATRSKIVVYQAKFLGCSLAAACFLFGLAAFYPKADKAMIKDLLPLIIHPQVTLLGVSLGYYFGAKGK